MNLDKIQVAIGSANHSKLDVSSTHITTASWLEPQPVYYRHMLPKEHLKGSGNVLSRLAPVAVPTYGRARINLRSFFVPFRTVFPNFTDFIVDTIGSNYSNSSLIASSPYIDMADIVALFVNNNNYSTVNTDPNAPYDFKIGSSQYTLGKDGRFAKKVFESLGYRIIWSAKMGELNVSALGLLCYAKVYYDWYSNSAYMDSAGYLFLSRLFKYNDPSSALSLNASQLRSIFSFVRNVCYDAGKTVFVNAWDNPVAPNNGLFSVLSGLDVTGSSEYVGTLANGTPVMSQDMDTDTTIGTQYIHQLLRSMTDYVKRNQLAGSRQVDRFLARFGISLDSAKVDRSIYISSQSIDIDFGSVMSHSETSGASLGDYKGQGLGRGEFGFDFSADEFGMFIVVSSIVPNAQLYQGIDRNNLHIAKTDFFTPEFDNLGVSAISKAEVYVSNNAGYGNVSNYEQVFGYAPRLYEYKQKQDYVTGDFVSPTTMAGGESWHLNRTLDDTSFGGIANQEHSLDFTRSNADFTIYDRIFQSEDSSVDKFYLVYTFAAEALAPCKSLFDTYDFEDAGQKISMSSNGTKVN